MKNVKSDRLEAYIQYHKEMQDIGDIDPQYPMLKYICDRFELNLEQRYWIAFLYSTNYCGPTTYFIYNDFPDFETTNLQRLERWWIRNKDKTLFQTDRKYIKLRDQLPMCFTSYKKLIGDKTQHDKFIEITNDLTPVEAYKKCYDYFIKIYGFGRYSMFLYLESVHVLTGLNIIPEGLDLNNSKLPCNGLCYTFGLDEYVRKKQKRIPKEALSTLESKLEELIGIINEDRPFPLTSIWNVETSLCAFKKLLFKKRYLGYYIDRQGKEIEIMQNNVKEGVDWSVLWDFRFEHFKIEYLKEFNCKTYITLKTSNNCNVELIMPTNWMDWKYELSESRYGLHGTGKLAKLHTLKNWLF